ncbi:hypothetical protein DFH09DRAFT_1355834 [Mycena vulgaris]|nr:hypothetical protein DFH09DRAFT_1355834 [Mycena vulgaris]
MPLLTWARLGVSTPFDPHHKFVSSPLLPPAALAALRLLLALYAVASLCTVLAFNVAAGIGPSFLSYFTQLSYIGVAAYYCAAAVQTLAYARYGRYPLRRWPRALQALHVLLQSTITTLPLIVTVVFWALLTGGDTFDTTFNTWSNISLHALNTPYALLDLLLTNTPPAPWLALPVQVALLVAYLGVAYVTRAAQGFYPYPFLDPHTQHAFLAVYIVGIALGACVVFVLVRGVAVLRQRFVVSRGLLPGDGDGERGSSEGLGDGEGRGGREGLEEWEEVGVPGDEATSRAAAKEGDGASKETA